MIPKIGFRKFAAFLLSLFVYVILFLTVVITGKINSPEVPTFAFQLGVGIASVTGAFYAGNVLSKKAGQDG
ncbi:MAG: hypothetical protein LCH52_05470 [Bacteroidetes bacterium]|nr:hypothetical protein [Bacteroidota bacterium]